MAKVANIPVNTQSKIIRVQPQDKYPGHYGVRANVACITSILKECETGIRTRYVDALREMIEGDPHCYSVLQTRANAISGRPWSVNPASTETEAEQAVAHEIAEFCERVIKAIPRWRQHVNGLMWSIVFGVSVREINWTRGIDGEFLISDLSLVHSRRLGYDDNWDLRLLKDDYGSFGLKFSDYPGKFMVFDTMLSDEYPTREGLGRELLYWLGFKRFAMRDMVSFVERFGKPYPDISWKTGREAADEDDIGLAERIAKEYGMGTMAGVAHPDTLTVMLEGNGSGKYTSGGSGESTPHKGLVTLVDENVSRLILGQSFTTNDEQRGVGYSGEPFENTQQYIFRSDAAQAEENINRDILHWIVLLNYGEEAVKRFMPKYQIEVDDQQAEVDFSKTVDLMVKNGHPVSAEWAARRLGWDMPRDGELILCANGNPRPFSSAGDMPPLQGEPSKDESNPSEDEGKSTEESSNGNS